MALKSFPSSGNFPIIFREESSPGIFEIKPNSFCEVISLEINPSTDWFTWYSTLMMMGKIPRIWQIYTISVDDIVRWSFKDTPTHGKKVGLTCFNLLLEKKTPIVITGKMRY